MAFSVPKPGGMSPRAKERELREANEKTLTPARRAKLISLQKREEMKDVLVKKFTERCFRLSHCRNGLVSGNLAPRRIRIFIFKTKRMFTLKFLYELCFRVNDGSIPASQKAANAEMIDAEVSNFLGTGAITEQNLKRLEKKIHSKTGGTMRLFSSRARAATS